MTGPDWRLRPIIALGRLGERGEQDRSWPERRAQAEAIGRRGRGLLVPAGPACEERDVTVPVDGGAITVRLYRWPDAMPQPLHVFLHGGGWCMGGLYERDPRCRQIAHGARCTVASVDYRLAPEHPYPTGLEDCYAALAWLVDNAARLGLDAERISVSGESAGANLAAALTLVTRDRSGPAICHQWLDVPAVDLTLQSPSIRDVPDGYLLDRSAIDEFLECYLSSPAQAEEPYASPLFDGDHSGLPPACITGCEYDKLRDETTRYARALRDAGVPVESRVLPGMVHPSFAFTRILPIARTYERDSIAALAAALHAA